MPFLDLAFVGRNEPRPESEDSRACKEIPL